MFLGTSDFNKIIESGGLFVDKTLFIKEFIESKTEVDVILRPRRFGKSTNLKMLQSFLSRSTSSNMGSIKQFFESSLIGQDRKFMTQHFCQYPVVFLSLKNCGGDSWPEMKTELWSCIRDMCRPHLPEISMASEFAEVNFNSFSAPDLAIMKELMLRLMEFLCDKSGGKRVVVLVDEYDAPLNRAFQNGFYGEASSFFSRFFTRALKDNTYLQKACFLGIVEVQGANILSTLNNMCVYSVRSNEFSSCFGFTVEEIQKVVDCEETVSRILAWYNGYTIGTRTVVNPWSFLSSIRFGRFESFWIDTSFTGTITHTLKPHMKNMLLQTFQLLFDPDPVRVPTLCSKVDYSSDSTSVVAVLHFLVHAGYLSYCTKDDFIGLLRIPNYEVRQHWQNHLVEMVRNTLFVEGSDSQMRLQESFTAVPFSKHDLETSMGELLNSSLSYMDTKSENSYHCFYLGCFQTAFDKLPNFSVDSNRESGTGRYDIFVAIEQIRRVFIFELKKSESQAQLKGMAQLALNQAMEKDYAAKFKGYQCFVIGVAFFHKTMSELEVKVLNN